MSHQGSGESSCGHSLGWIVWGKMCFTHRDARVRPQADGHPTANFNHQTHGRVWWLVLLGSSCRQQSRDGSCAVSPRREVCPPGRSDAERGRGCSTALARADAAPWAAIRAVALGGRAGERVASGMRSLRLGGCLSPGGIMSSERNASAYE